MDSTLLHDYIAGAIAGSAGIVIGHPLDTAKVQLQTKQVASQYSGSCSALVNIYRHGWTHGMFRGMMYPVVSYSAIGSVFFGVYGNTTKLLSRWSRNDQKSYSLVFLAGCVAGGAQVIPATPIELVKVILQSQIPSTAAQSQMATQGKSMYSDKYFKGPTDCVLYIIRQHGLRGLYKGCNILALRDVPTYGVYCLTYELICDELNRISCNDALSSFLAGGFAGVFCWTCAIPMDVVKSRLQADTENYYKGIMDCVVKTYRYGGIHMFYRGLLVTCIRAFPVSAVTFLVYSQCLKHLNEYNPPKS